MKTKKLFVSLGAVLVLVVTGYVFISGPELPEAAIASTEHHEDEKSHVKLTGEQIQKAGIKSETAGPAVIREVLSLYGTIAPNAEHMRDVAARFPGTIRSVAKKVGDSVSQGETLAVVESNESLQAYHVQSPLAGVITARYANPGEQTGDKVLFSVADLSGVWVELSLFPRDAAKARVGQSVRVKSVDAGVVGEGAIIYVAPVGTAASQTRIARVLLDNKQSQWAPGLYVTAEVTLDENAVPVAIRNEAIQTIVGVDNVFVHTPTGFEPRAVRLGHSDGEYSEILEGVKAGDSYVTQNSYTLKSELGKGEAAHED